MRFWLGFLRPKSRPKAQPGRQPHGWANVEEKFFQPRRYDKTKAQLAFRQQLARLSRARRKSSARDPLHPFKTPAAQTKTGLGRARGGGNLSHGMRHASAAISATCASCGGSTSSASGACACSSSGGVSF